MKSHRILLIDKGFYIEANIFTNFSSLFFFAGEPNNVNNHEHCGEFITGSAIRGMWNDASCNSKRGYICKKPSLGKRV